MYVPSIGTSAAAKFDGGNDAEYDGSDDAEYVGGDDAEYDGGSDGEYDSHDTMQSHDVECLAQYIGSNSSNYGRSDGGSQDYHSDVSSDGAGKDCDDNSMKDYLSAVDWGMGYVNSIAGRFWCGVPENRAATRVLRLAHPVCIVQKIRATKGNRVSEYTFGPAGKMHPSLVASCKSGVEEHTLCQHPASNCLVVDGALVVSCNWRFAAKVNWLCQKCSACSCVSRSFGCLRRPWHLSCVEDDVCLVTQIAVQRMCCCRSAQTWS